MSSSNRIFSSFELILSNDITRLEVDLCKGVCNMPKIDFPLVVDLSSWFSEQLLKEHISITDIDSAILSIDFDYKSVPTNLDKVALFRLSSRCNLTANGKLFEASSNTSTWYNRGRA